jgi:hypothetical protein
MHKQSDVVSSSIADDERVVAKNFSQRLEFRFMHNRLISTRWLHRVVPLARVRGWLLLAICALLPVALAAQPKNYPLTSAAGLRLHNVVAEPATLQGKPGLKVAMSEAAPQLTDERLALITDLEFGDGVIEAEIAGDVRPDGFADARGFVGIAFRVQSDLRTYDAFYLRPTNGQADDQLRRNHSTQYVHHPEWTWSKLRQDFPAKYESYVDLTPGTWTKVKIEVRGDKARLYVTNMEQPTLIVNDLKSGAEGKGAVALWIDVSTIAHFRNLTISK